MKKIFESSEAPAPIGPYSQAVEVGGFIFVGGQLGMTPSGAFVFGGLAEQARQSLKNVEAVLKEAELGMDAVVKTTIYLTDLSQFQQLNAVYTDFFQVPYPARATVEVKALPKGALVEIEAVAAR